MKRAAAASSSPASSAAASKKKKLTRRSGSTTTAASGTAKKAATKRKTTTTTKKAASASASSKKKKKATSSTATNTTAKSTTTEPPLHTLVLDNGGDTVKYGWSNNNKEEEEEGICHRMPNFTARLPQQITILVGDELHGSVTNPNSVLTTTRSTERGIITNFGNQIQVWKRILDKLHVEIPLQTDTATAFGWNNTSTRTKKQKQQKQQQLVSTSNSMIPASQCAVLLALPPYVPRTVLDQIMWIWMEDLGFGHVGFCNSAVVAAATIPRPLLSLPSSSKSDNNNKPPASASDAVPVPVAMNVPNIACVVDLGWSSTTIVPVYNGKVIRRGQSSIRRIPLGARHLINIWKYHCSYRQWNLMDQEWILRDVFEKTACVSLDFTNAMEIARRLPGGRRPYDLEYILPDYDTTFAGVVRIPEGVRQELERQQREKEEGEEEDEEEDEDYEEKDMEDDDEDDDVEKVLGEGVDNVQGANEPSDDDEEESPEEIQNRLLQQRREDEQRRRELEAEQQILNISVERFAIPEALFRPSDVGLPLEWANLPTAIVQAVEACPAVYRAGLYRSIQLTGGLSRLAKLQERLETELRALAPRQYAIDISSSETPMDGAWLGTQKLTNTHPFTVWSISRDEWEKASKRGAWSRLLASEGGHFV